MRSIRQEVDGDIWGSRQVWHECGRGGSEGYVFVGTRVLPIEGKIEGRGTYKRRKVETNGGGVHTPRENGISTKPEIAAESMIDEDI